MACAPVPTMSTLRRAMAPLLGVLVVLLGAFLFVVASASPAARNAVSRPQVALTARTGSAFAIPDRAPATFSGATAKATTRATETGHAGDPDELERVLGPRDDRFTGRRVVTEPSAEKRFAPPCDNQLLADCHLASAARPPRAPPRFAAPEETESPVARSDSPRSRRAGRGPCAPRGPPSRRPA